MGFNYKRLFPFRKGISRVERVQLVVNLFVRLTLVLAFIGALFTLNWIVLMVSAAVFVLSFLPEFFERKSRVNLPVEIQILAVLFIYASLFLGEIHGYYTRFWWWDLILHSLSALVFGFMGFGILYVLYKGDKIRANPWVIALFSFCFAVAIGAVWEVFEFGMDQAFGLNMQKSGLFDTMGDLIVDTIGALIASVLGFIYLKKENLFFIGRIMKGFREGNPRLFKS